MDFQIKKGSRNYGNMKDLYRGTNNPSSSGGGYGAGGAHGLTISPNNVNSYREVLSEVRSPHVQMPANDFAIPNIGVFPQSVTNASAVGAGLVPGAMGGTQKRNARGMANTAQFPRVAGIGGKYAGLNPDSGYWTMKARQSVGKRSQNRTITDGTTSQVPHQMIDLGNMLEQQRHEEHALAYKSGNSTSSKQSVSAISGSQNSLQKKFASQKQQQMHQ